MDNSLKNFIIKFFIVLFSFTTVCGGAYMLNQYIHYRQEQAKIEAHKTAQNYIADMKTICGFSQLHDDEQKELSNCGDDIEKAKALFVNIVEKRIVYWKTEFEASMVEIDRLENIKKQYLYDWNQLLEDQYTSTRISIIGNALTAKEQKEFLIKSLESIKSWNEAEAIKRIKKEPTKPKNAV